MAEIHKFNLVCVAAEGFLLKNEFVCKEFCLFDFDSNFLYHTTIKSPKKSTDYSASDKQQIFCETSTYGLEFDSGEIEIGQFIEKVFPIIEEKRVVVQHPFIANWLKEFFISRGDIDCVAVGSWFEEGPFMNDESKDACDYHNSNSLCEPKCALYSVFGLRKGILTILPHLKDLENTFCIALTGFDLFNHGYLFKEICLVSLSTTYRFHTTIKTPKDFENILHWYSSGIRFETKHVHGLDHDCGEITLDELIETISPIIKGKKVLVKNFDQIIYLWDLFGDDCNFKLIEAGGPQNKALAEDIPNCTNHQSAINSEWKKYCAMRIAMMLKKSVLDLFEKITK